MQKQKELADPKSCLNKADDDEPIFVLRAQDMLAPDVVRFWAGAASMAGAAEPKIEEALNCALAMDNWQTSNSWRVKKPD